MLKILEKDDLEKLLKFCRAGILSTRISCYALSYGFDRDFLTFWGNNDSEEFNCIVAKFENNITVCADEDADFDELSEFLSVIGYDTLTCSQKVAERLGFTDFTVKNGFVYSGEITFLDTENASESDINAIYNLISDAIPDSFPRDKESYLNFLSDFTFRQRRGYARAKCIHCDGKVVSSAITSAESENSAVISGVACDENYRKYGFGKKTVLSLASELKKEKSNVYVIALGSSAEGFYKHIGFCECEKIAFI